jgi:signal transduction histidine kinase/ABC-type uncharacterized transport system substrate-binding protein
MHGHTGARRLAMVAIVFGSVCPAASAQVRHPGRTVLTIHWGSESDPSSERLDAAIRRVLLGQTDAPVHYFAEYLETEEFPAEKASKALRDYILRKYEGRHVDVVIAVASAALQFAVRYRDELFPDVPIVFLAVALPQAVVDRTARGITGVLNDTPFSETLELALKLHPSTTRVFVVAQAPTVVGYDEKLQSALSPFANRVELTYVKKRTVPELLSAVKAIPPQSVILYTRYAPDEPVPNVYPGDIAHMMADVARAPIYGVSDLYIGSGVVGGVIRSGDAAGARLGEIARQILDGTPPEDIPITPVMTAPMFDWRQVKRWGIDPSRLPPESRILFRTPTAWESYRRYIVSAIAVVGVQLLLIVGLLTQRTGRRVAEGTVRAREATLQTSYDRIRQLAGRLIDAQETARASLAHDLHDDICQRLAMVSTMIDRLRASSGSIQNRAVQRDFAQLAGDTRILFDAVRRLSHELHPDSLRLLGLAPALKTLCAEVAVHHGVRVTFTAVGDSRHVRPDVAVCFFRIVQESLRNAVVHGKAHQMAVTLTTSAGELEMTITDDGHGFNVDEVNQDGSGLGLVTMQERVHVVGGSLDIVTGLQQGTTVRVKAPLKNS